MQKDHQVSVREYLYETLGDKENEVIDVTLLSVTDHFRRIEQWVCKSKTDLQYSKKQMALLSKDLEKIEKDAMDELKAMERHCQDSLRGTVQESLKRQNQEVRNGLDHLTQQMYELSQEKMRLDEQKVIVGDQVLKIELQLGYENVFDKMGLTGEGFYSNGEFHRTHDHYR